ncbi:TonB family protein [Pseudoalteromonas sp. JBTF-M23]|uniref:Protein TonB n=1 Tax=Pseudoalteromonas caenipelagi TaxID=2726988 RepID=A0A849VKM1_9GAMM|nr:energy transducer TonB [Pseudoalteromonas caenipelagi]NOU52334.1 TonB family protein [Pseudoalteromonas caenipelagi]
MYVLDFQNNSLNYKKLFAAVLGGTAMTAAAFVFMQQLVSQDEIRIPVPKPIIDIELGQVKKDTPAEEKPKLPEPPKMQRPPTKVVNNTPPTTEISTATPFTPQVPVPKMTLSPPTMMATEGGATPIVRAEPKYPITAARDGIQGWVKLAFSISPNGEVIDVNVLDAEPKRVFERAAITALKRWKYRPKIENGQAVMQTNQNVVLEFNLAQ